ncbi:MAG: deoxyguanosinetriphosphate triphosphohydrolase, partial [Cyanobacteria bacterium P01_A01_bin.40]
TLFEIYLQAISERDLSFIPARFVREFLETEAKLDNPNQLSPEQTRMAVDIVAGMSEAEAVIQYRRLTGISQGSFLDSWN